MLFVIQTTEGRKNLDNTHLMYSRFFVAKAPLNDNWHYSFACG